MELNDGLDTYDVNLDAEAFKQRHAGLLTDPGYRLTKKQIVDIMTEFVKDEADAFFKAHPNFTMEDILRAGPDRFVYLLGWSKPKHVARWKNNKVRVGLCGHCRVQFIAMMLQTNHGLCGNCRPLYSTKAIRKFIVNQLNVAERYQHAHRDLIMDFYVMFYHDTQFRNLFLADSESAKQIEALEVEVPSWVEAESGPLPKAPSEKHGAI